MENESNDQRWLELIRAALDYHLSKGGYLVCFPEYRPDLVLSMTHALGFRHFDFRNEVMGPLGWEAHTLRLEDLDGAIAERAAESGLVIHNVEALLSTKAADIRRRWLDEVLLVPWPNPVIIPLSLYASDAPDRHPRVVALDAEALPEPTLLSRLLI